MRIRFWGVRGSIPVCGAEYLRYGGNTACVEVRDSKNELTIIDAGTGIRRLGKELLAAGAKSCRILLTHSHWDHIMGFPFFEPLYRKSFAIELIGCPHAKSAVKDMVANIMRAPNFPVDFDDVSASVKSARSCNGLFRSMAIEPVPLNHPNGGNGYIFREDGKKFVFLTDNELLSSHKGGLDFPGYVKACKGADLLVHDADYLPDEYSSRIGWGHSTPELALELAMQSGVKRLGLFHHNQDRADSQVDEIVNNCRARAQKAGLRLEIFAAAEDMRIEV
ncbi:MAG: MBL fold metallo-hydrolase [Elusimicrobiales bacterium]